MLKYKYLGEDDIFSHTRYKTFKLTKNYSEFNLSDIFELLKGKKVLCVNMIKQRNLIIWSSVFDIKNKVIYRCEGNPKQKICC